MGRWRPPRARSSPYITPQGFERLQEELKGLWQRRAEVVKALSAAAAEGDRSENAEYIYRKKELGGIDRRIRYLQKRMPELNIVDSKPASDRVFFGARVELESETETDSAKQYRIVGADEIDTEPEYISIDSPLAKALLKKYVGDSAKLEIADKQTEYMIKKISYD